MRATYFFSEYPIAYRILASYIQNLEVYIISTDCRIAFL